MKTKLSLLFCLIVLIGCEDTSVEEPRDATALLISGKWKKTEAYISSGGPQYWVDAEKGETITFQNNGSFSSDRYAECATGNFTVKENVLSLNYDCPDFNPNTENEEGLITYSIEQFTTYFILTPTSGPICVEGCSYKYVRVE
ncbi:lipocalin family protein [Leeuwenhoekiella sp. H156]|uniref:lipocalin family protein n=1 Tax=Leeuwenhoekiella sp. H156 TaxID=3450128 RepID=UPI003FA448C8